MDRGFTGDPTRKFPEGFRGSFQAPPEGIFSKTSILVQPELFLKLQVFKQYPDSSEQPTLKYPACVASRGPLVVVCY